MKSRQNVSDGCLLISGGLSEGKPKKLQKNSNSLKILYHYRPKTLLREGNVFTLVCSSTGKVATAFLEPPTSPHPHKEMVQSGRYASDQNSCVVCST